MGTTVTGISQDGNVDSLVTALKAAGLSAEPLTVIASDGLGILPSASAGSGILAGNGSGTGTGVPGLTSGTNTLPSYGAEFERDGSVLERLGDLEIPDDELDNYVEAVEAGRSVVGYFAADDTIDRVEAIFAAAGLAKVKRF